MAAGRGADRRHHGERHSGSARSSRVSHCRRRQAGWPRCRPTCTGHDGCPAQRPERAGSRSAPLSRHSTAAAVGSKHGTRHSVSEGCRASVHQATGSGSQVSARNSNPFMPHLATASTHLPAKLPFIHQPPREVWVVAPAAHGQAHALIVDGRVALLTHTPQRGLVSRRCRRQGSSSSR